MSKCWNCGVEIADPVQVCPLCQCIMERDRGEPSEPIYPYLHAEREIRRMQRASRIYLAAALVTMVILTLADLRVHGRPGWVILVGILLAYGYFTLRVSITAHTGYRLVTFLQIVLGGAVLAVIDVLTGYRGWSFTYVLPVVCMMVDLAIFVLMIVNKRDWQSYIPFQIVIIVFSVVPFVLRLFGLVTLLTVPMIGAAVAVLFFVVTLIVGGRRAREELYRRFHA